MVDIDTIYPMVYTVDRKFPEIYQNIDADLSPYLYTEYHYTFDKIEDCGLITMGGSLRSYTAPEGTPDIDKISFDLGYALRVEKNEDTEKYELKPVLVLESVGAFRPYLTKLAINSGDDTIVLEEVTSTGSLDGIQIKEKAEIMLTDEAQNMIESGKEIKIEVIGRNESWKV